MTAPALVPTEALPDLPTSITLWEENTTDAKRAFAAQFPVHVGVDIAKKDHWAVAGRLGGRRHAPVMVSATRESFDAFDAYLVTTFPDVPRPRILIGVEPAGRFGETLEAYLRGKGYTLVRVPPSITYRTKEVEDNSPQKDDKKDARQICKLVGDGLFVRAVDHEPYFVELRILTGEVHRLAKEATALKNACIAAFDVAFPELLELFSDFDKVSAQLVMGRWPLAQDFAAGDLDEIAPILKKASRGQVGRAKVAEILAVARNSIALTSAPETRRAHIARLLARRAFVAAQRAEVEARLAALLPKHHHGAMLLTVPEVSVVCATTLLAQIGDPDSFASPKQILKLAGMNLSSKSSGRSIRGRARQSKRGRPALRRQLFLLAGRWCQPNGLYRPLYNQMLARGVPKTAAVCAIARRLVPLLFRILQTGEAFDQAKWYAERQRMPVPATPKVTSTRKTGVRKLKATILAQAATAAA